MGRENAVALGKARSIFVEHGAYASRFDLRPFLGELICFLCELCGVFFLLLLGGAGRHLGRC